MSSSNTMTPPTGGSFAVLDAGEIGEPGGQAREVDMPGPEAPVLDVPELAFVPRTAIAGLNDDALMSLHSDLAELRRRTDSNLAVLADEIARRSHHELGHAGLAQRLGSRTPENLIQRLTGVGARAAGALVRVGSMLAGSTAADLSDDRGAPDPAGTGGETDSFLDSTLVAETASPWLRPLAIAVGETRLSVDAADAIGRALGQPTDGVTSAQLESAAAQLAVEATLLTVEQLAVRARQARALLDLDSEPQLIDAREAVLRDRRYLHLSRQADGMTRLNALLDPESAALVRDAVDAATSPRRDGPRFLGAAERENDDRERAVRMLADSRKAPQVALDAVVELIRLGGAVAPSAVIGVRSPAVQVVVAERDLRARRGLAFFEGQTEPVGTDTAERHICASGALPIVIDTAGDVVALGRESRLFTRRQRIALAARDGGCRFPGCDRPPSWTEAHHIVSWSAGGSTDLHDGVLLCRHHHLLLHNNGWRLTRVHSELHVIPPPDVDRDQKPIPTPSKSVPLERTRAG